MINLYDVYRSAQTEIVWALSQYCMEYGEMLGDAISIHGHCCDIWQTCLRSFGNTKKEEDAN